MMSALLRAFSFHLRFFLLFALLLLVQDYLYFLGSFLIYQTTLELLANTGMLLLLLFIPLIGGSACFTLLWFLCGRLRQGLLAVTAYVLWGLVFYYTLGSVGTWMELTFHMKSPALPSLLKGIVVMATLLPLAWMKRERVISWTGQFMIPPRGGAVVALVLFGLPLGYHFYQLDGSRPPPCDTKPLAEGSRPRVADPHKPDIILVTFDALTARDMSLHGYPLPTTPNLSALAQESTRFDYAYANGTWTRPGVVSLLSGRFPSNHKVIHVGGYAYSKHDELKTLPSLLSSRLGYRTVAVVSNLLYAHPFANGTKRSFHQCPMSYMEASAHPSALQQAMSWMAHQLREWDFMVVDWIYSWSQFNRLYEKVIKPWLNLEAVNSLEGNHAEITFREAEKALSTIDGPLFLWVHVRPPHDPFLPPAPYLKQFLPEDTFLTVASQEEGVLPHQGYYPNAHQPLVDKMRLRYDENILYADAAFGAFLTFLRQSGHLEKSLLWVTSDHGESFENNWLKHMSEVPSQPLIHIPLLLHEPGQQQGTVVTDNVQQADLAPSILSWLGEEIPSWMDGDAFWPIRAAKARVTFASSLRFAKLNEPLTRGGLVAIEGRYKLVWQLASGKVSLFDVVDDPRESRDIAALHPERVARLRAQVQERLITPFDQAPP